MRLNAEHDETFAVTNNHFAGKAVANGLELLHLLSGKPVRTTAEIVESYPHLRTFTELDGQQSMF